MYCTIVQCFGMDRDTAQAIPSPAEPLQTVRSVREVRLRHRHAVHIRGSGGRASSGRHCHARQSSRASSRLVGQTGAHVGWTGVRHRHVTVAQLGPLSLSLCWSRCRSGRARGAADGEHSGAAGSTLDAFSVGDRWRRGRGHRGRRESPRSGGGAQAGGGEPEASQAAPHLRGAARLDHSEPLAVCFCFLLHFMIRF